jgi:hypothetical protein
MEISGNLTPRLIYHEVRKYPPQTYRADRKWVDPVAGLEAECAVYRCEFYACRVRGLLILLLYFFICSSFIGAGRNSKLYSYG